MNYLLFILMSLGGNGPRHYSQTTVDTLPVIDCNDEPAHFFHEFRGGNQAQNWSREIFLPASGRFVEESHYVTSKDQFPNGRLFASSLHEGIEQHLASSFLLYQKYDPSITFGELYGQPWQRTWTPAENGDVGQGSVGDLQKELLTPEKEMWLLSMMWAKNQKPEPGTKFLLRANGKSVVVIAGFETGPGNQMYLGGITREAHKWLGTTNDSRIEISLLKDQQVAPGPVICNQ